MKAWFLDLQVRWRRGFLHLACFVVALFLAALPASIIQLFVLIAPEQTVLWRLCQFLCFLALAPLAVEVMLPVASASEEPPKT